MSHSRYCGDTLKRFQKPGEYDGVVGIYYGANGFGRRRARKKAHKQARQHDKRVVAQELDLMDEENYLIWKEFLEENRSEWYGYEDPYWSYIPLDMGTSRRYIEQSLNHQGCYCYACEKAEEIALMEPSVYKEILEAIKEDNRKWVAESYHYGDDFYEDYGDDDFY